MKRKDRNIRVPCGSPTWAWYGGERPASGDVISVAEAAEEDAEGPEIFYDSTCKKGAFYETIVRIAKLMNLLREKPDDLRSWGKLDGLSTFILTLIDRAPTDIRGYASILQRFGSFRFNDDDSPLEKKNKIIEVFSVEEETSIYSQIRDRAKLLDDIWEPKEDSFLDYVIVEPSRVGEIIEDRLNCSKSHQFRIIGHSFRNVRSTDLKGLAEARTVAYQRGNDIHLISEVCPVLDKWDEDSWDGDVKQATLLDALLLHEITELILREKEPEICPLDAHIVASTFERYLKGPLLTIAVEDFFIDWPKPLGIEVAELQRKEMSQQIAWWETAFGSHSSSIDVSSDIDWARFEQEVILREENNSTNRRGGKVYRSKDGKLYRLEGEKKVFVRKKDSQ
ncbi:MAG: hypothetical protein VX294_04115 [Candidatus Latescibacterota bacterium]|nr:hypothetical protein [Candidatus Latescibacterota bacterium]